jgi:hypothetical protein
MYSYGWGGGDQGPQTDKHLPSSTFTGPFLIYKKSRHLGFGVFIDIWSMVWTFGVGDTFPFGLLTMQFTSW